MNHYEVLGLRWFADQDEIEAAYETLHDAFVRRPTGDPAIREYMRYAEHAYRVLTDPVSLSAYDIAIAHDAVTPDIEVPAAVKAVLPRTAHARQRASTAAQTKQSRWLLRFWMRRLRHFTRR